MCLGLKEKGLGESHLAQTNPLTHKESQYASLIYLNMIYWSIIKLTL